MQAAFLQKASYLAFFALFCATTAHADTLNNSYYSQGTVRDNYQYANTAPSTGTAPSSYQWTSSEDTQPDTALFRFNNTAWVAAGTSFNNYKETVSPIPDSERGWLPSVAGGVDYMTNSNLYLSVDASGAFGNEHYNGAVYDSNTNTYDIPYQTRTNETVATVDGKVGQGFYVSNRVMLIPYGDLGFRYWDRDLGQGQDEKYQTMMALGGLMLEIAPTDRLVLSGYASGGTTFFNRMTTSGNAYQLGSAGVEKVGAKIGYDLTRKVELFTTLDYGHFHNGRSQNNTEIINNVEYISDEPGSRTSDTTMRVGLGYHFR